ncbi:hypothetical protein FRC0355_00235 [Corynebacterium diphtheriae]|nr:hypothetical protein FRC0355_00235 [Corynebacterium diphtheriae]
MSWPHIKDRGGLYTLGNVWRCRRRRRSPARCERRHAPDAQARPSGGLKAFTTFASGTRSCRIGEVVISLLSSCSIGISWSEFSGMVTTTISPAWAASSAVAARAFGTSSVTSSSSRLRKPMVAKIPPHRSSLGFCVLEFEVAGSWPQKSH